MEAIRQEKELLPRWSQVDKVVDQLVLMLAKQPLLPRVSIQLESSIHKETANASLDRTLTTLNGASQTQVMMLEKVVPGQMRCTFMRAKSPICLRARDSSTES